VTGLLGYAGSAGHLICAEEDVAALPDLERVCLVSQTTFNRALFDRIAARVRARFGENNVVVKKTICAATETRQSETEVLAKQVEAMIVVGGRNSANTTRLARISQDCGTPTQLVESEDEIDWKTIAHCKAVGVTAGASTPNWMIKRITDYLQFMDRTQQYTPYNIVRRSVDIASNVNLFVALGAMAIYYVSCRLQGLEFTWCGGILALLYFFSMYLWNSMTSLETTQHLGLSRYRFYDEHRGLLFALAGISIAVLLTISFLMGKKLFLLMLFATVAGSAYHVTIVPKIMRQLLRYKNLKDIPASRDLFIALAWSTVLTFIPLAMSGAWSITPLVVVCFGWIFILAFLRSLIFDLRDIEGDRIMGRETLITIVGEKRARKAMYLIIWLCVGLCIAVPWIAGLETYRPRSDLRFLSQIPALLYAAFFIKWNPRLKSSTPVLFNIMADGLIYLAGFGAFCSALILGH
jgi:4-hydroxy-3-methylbut-2-enyl diphosphate reductase